MPFSVERVLVNIVVGNCVFKIIVFQPKSFFTFSNDNFFILSLDEIACFYLTLSLVIAIILLICELVLLTV